MSWFRGFLALAMVFAVLNGSSVAVILPNPMVTGSATAYNASFVASNVFDNNLGTCYASQSKGIQTYINFDFGVPTLIDRFIFMDRNFNFTGTGNRADTVKSFNLVFSDNSDFSNSRTLSFNGAQPYGVTGAYRNPPNPPVYESFTFPAQTAQYVKWQVTSTNNNATDNCGACEIRFAQAPTWDGTVLRQLASPTVLASSPGYNANYQVANLFDQWSGSPAYNTEDTVARSSYCSAGAGTSTFVSMDFGSARRFAGFEYEQRWYANAGDQAATVQLIFSDQPDFSNVLGTVDVACNVGANAETSVSFAPVVARYVKWQVTSLSGGVTTGNVGGTAMRLFEVPPPTLAWTGAASSEWSTATIADPKNWIAGAIPADYAEPAYVVFGDAGATSFSVDIAAGNVAPLTATFNNSANDYTLSSSGSYGIAGTAALIKQGTGNLTIANANAYTGGTTINAGTLTAAVDGALGAGPVAMNPPSGSATLKFPSAMPAIRSLASSGAGASNVVLGNTSGTASPTQLTIGADTAVSTFAGTISDLSATDSAAVGSLVKAGNGPGSVLYLDGPNTYSGSTTVNGGFLVLRNNNAIGSTAGVAVNSGGSLQLEKNAANPAITITDKTATINGDGPSAGRGALASWSGVNAWTGPVVLAGNSTVFVNSDSLTLSNAITETAGGPYSLTKTGGGMLTLAGATPNTYTGVTTVNGGVLVLQKDNNVLAVPGNLTMTGGVSQVRVRADGQIPSTAVLTYNNPTNWNYFSLCGRKVTLAGIKVIGANSTVIENWNYDNRTTTGDGELTVNNPAGDISAIGGYLRDNDGNPTAAKLNLVKDGEGTLVLSGGNIIYTGATAVNGGRLVVDNTPNSGSAISVNSTRGATLAGTGPVRNTVFLNGGTIEPGINGGGALSVNNLAMKGGGTARFSIGAANSKIIVTNAAGFSTAGTTTVTVNAVGPVSPGQYSLIEYSGGIGGGGFSGLTLGTINAAGVRSVVAHLLEDPAAVKLDVIGSEYPIWNGDASGDWDIDTTPNWRLNLAGTATKYLQSPPDTVLFDDTAAGTTTVKLATTVTPFAVIVNNAAKDYTISGAGWISGTTGLAKSGAATLTLSTINDYTGATTINAGTLQLGDGASDGAVSSSSGIANNGTLKYSVGGSHSYGGPITGAGSLVKDGAGTVILSGANTYSGGTTINAGTLQVGDGVANGAIPGAYNIGADGRLVLYQTGNLTIGPAYTGAGTLYLRGNNDNGANLTKPYHLANAMSASFTGKIVLDKARINPNAGPADFGGATAIEVKPGGQLGIWQDGTYSIPLTIAGQGWYEGAAPGVRFGALRLQALTGSPVWAGPITLADNARIASGGAGTTSITGNIAGDYELELGGDGAGNSYTLVLAPSTGANTYGSTRVSKGATVVAGNAGALSSGAMIVNGGTLQTNGLNFAFANLQGGSGRVQNGHATDNSTITVGADDSDQAYGGRLVDGGSGTLGLVKTGAGSLTLSALNTHTGGTAVEAGRLAAAAPGTLGNGPVTLSGGTLRLRAATALSGFNRDGDGWQVNSFNVPTPPFVTPDVLTLTDNGGSEARSAFFATPVPVRGGFVAKLTYQVGGSKAADGVALVLQTDSRGPAALGNAGGWLGYANTGAITPSAAIALHMWPSPINGIAGTAYGTNGVLSPAVSVSPVVLNSGNPIDITLTYDAAMQTLQEDLYEQVTGNTWSYTYPGFDLQTVLGNVAYIGFTGATGGAVSTQTISNFTFEPTAGMASYANEVVASAGKTSTVELAATAASPSFNLGNLTLGDGATLLVTAANTAPAGQAYGLTTGPVTLQGNVKLSIANNTNEGGSGAGTLTPGPISDGGNRYSFTKGGDGTLVFSAANAYTGGTKVEAGTLLVNNVEALPAGGSLTIGPGGTVVLASGLVTAGAGQSAAPAPVPEPGSTVLLGAALAATATLLIRRRNRGAR